jgi:hypothetical protein
MQEGGAMVSAQIDIGESIVVVVADRAAKERAMKRIQSGFPCDVTEAALPIASVEADFISDEQDIQIAILVEVEKGAAISHRVADGDGPLYA